MAKVALLYFFIVLFLFCFFNTDTPPPYFFIVLFFFNIHTPLPHPTQVSKESRSHHLSWDNISVKPLYQHFFYSSIVIILFISWVLIDPPYYLNEICKWLWVWIFFMEHAEIDKNTCAITYRFREYETFSNSNKSLPGCLEDLFNPMESYPTLFWTNEG